jgi:hypothetical protein
MIALIDWMEINEFLSRYCWAIDEGDAETFASLWTEDGALTGVLQPRHGRAELEALALENFERHGRRMRHVYSNLICEYGPAGAGEVRVRFYNHARVLGEGARSLGLALCHATVVRIDGQWFMRSNDVDNPAEARP